ncbi:MAG: RnfABCDGE type electron transport complex subunit D [Proteobacteria bacterium]|nr:RnfABCDGE type electron transport complex subunit D [Pseudomonadota bacterium]
MDGRTGIAPHIRDGFSFAYAMRVLVLALVPSLVIGVFNAGFQANVRLAAPGLSGDLGWRAGLLDALGIGHDPSAMFSALVHGLLYVVPVFIVVFLVAWGFSALFARMRKTPIGSGVGEDILVLALLFTMLLPATIPLWQAALGITFAVVMGREIFGGAGKYFLNPPLTGLAFLYVTYPKEMTVETNWAAVDAFTSPTYLQLVGRDDPGTIASLGTTWMQSFIGLVPGPIGTTSALACVFAAVYLIRRGIISGRVVTGALIGMIAAALLVNLMSGDGNAYIGISWYWHLVMGSFAFGAVFLATDATSSAMTNRGRWIYGLLVGVMVIVIRVGNGHHPDGVMFAILLANIFAPLIDYGVMWANIRRRAKRDA